MKKSKYIFGVSLSTLISLFLVWGTVLGAVTLSNNIQIGSGTPDLTLNGDDLYVNGTFEVNREARFDGVLSLTEQSSLASLPTDGSLQHFGNDLLFTSNNYRYNVTKRIATTTAIKVVSTWIGRTAAEQRSWQAVEWSPALGLFAAVTQQGSGIRIMTSPDGITWTARTQPEASAWQDIVWAPELGLFVVVAGAGTNRVMTSPDGITWTARSAAEANSWHAVVWSPELGLLVAVASSEGTNRVMTSPDGITWTARVSAEQNYWDGLAWSPELGLFAAVSENGTNRIMTSPDGITWTARAAPEANSWWSIVWSSELGLFAAVAYDGVNSVMTSPDGITWTARAEPESGWNAITWSSEFGLFAAVSWDGNNNGAMTSPDGINWTARFVGGDSYNYITWSPELGIFVAIGDGTNQVLTTRPISSPSLFPALTIESNISGMTTDNAVLTINNASSTASADVYIDLKTGTVSRWLVGVDDSDSNKLRLAPSAFNATSSGLTINQSGFVGIGTTNPSVTLEITSSATTTLNINSSSGSQGSCLVMKDSLGVTKYVRIVATSFVINTDSCQ